MATAPAPAAGKLDPAVVRTALILIVGLMAVIFDTTIVSVALHTLALRLHTSVTTIQWVTTGYLLALGIAVPLSTWGLRRFGGKRLWMFSLTVFLIGSIGSSLAWNVGSLIGWRVVQGIGGGLMLPLMTTLIFQAAGGRSLGKLVTYVALPALLGPILGPLIGGAILTHLSWRIMFWVNVPFCTAGLLLAWRYQQIGGSFGTAVLAVILQDAIVSHHGTLAGAFHIAFWWSIGFSAIAVPLSLWLPGAHRPQPAETARARQPALAADGH